MLLGNDKEEDWKDFLSEDSRAILAELLDSIKKHRGAYTRAEDVKVAQLWCALVEMKKEFKETTKMIEKLQEPFKAIVAIGEAEKRKAIEKLITEIVRPEEVAEREATQKLVDSLMKF